MHLLPEGVEAGQLEAVWVVQVDGYKSVVGGVGVDGEVMLIVLINAYLKAGFLYLLNTVAAGGVVVYKNLTIGCYKIIANTLDVAS